MAIVPENSPLLGFIGGGVKFGFRFNTAGKLSETVEDVQGTKIVENIRFLLSTSPGERVGNPEFGSAVPRLLFEQNDEVLKDTMFVAIVESIARWEPRVTVEGIGFPELNKNNLIVVIIFSIRGSTERNSTSFSFNRTDGL